MGFLDLFFKAFHSVSNEASLDKYLKSKPEFFEKLKILNQDGIK